MVLSVASCKPSQKMVFILNNSKQPISLNIPDHAEEYFFGKTLGEIKLDASGESRKVAIRSEYGKWSKADKKNLYIWLHQSTFSLHQDSIAPIEKIHILRFNFAKELLVIIK